MKITMLTTFLSGRDGLMEQGKSYEVPEKRALHWIGRKWAMAFTEPAPKPVRPKPEPEKPQPAPRSTEADKPSATRGGLKQVRDKDAGEEGN